MTRLALVLTELLVAADPTGFVVVNRCPPPIVVVNRTASPTVSAPGVAGPTFRGGWYDGHDCPKCGRQQLQVSAGSVRGVHSHTCVRCGTTWSHDAALRR